MTNTTPEFWAVDGVSLQTFAYNITTWGGDRQAPPPARGDNITVPGEVGSIWSPKIPDSRTMTLAMWVQGATEDGTYPADASRIQQFEQNWSMLRKLLWDPYRQFTLTKQIVTPAHLVADIAFPASTITVAAKAQFAGGLNPTMIGHGGAATFSVDLFLADPFFYGPEVQAPVGFPFTVLGDARVHDIRAVVEAGGTLSNDTQHVSLTNTLGSQVHLNVRDWTANLSLNPVSSVAASITNVDDGTDDHWLYLNPGVQQLSGNASAVFYKPRYF